MRTGRTVERGRDGVVVSLPLDPLHGLKLWRVNWF